MSPRGGASAARRHLLFALLRRAATAALVIFHAWLLWTHVFTGRLADPAVAVRWVVGAGLFAGLVALSRFGVPVLFGRKAAVIWTLVALLHCHAAVTAPDASEPQGTGTTAALVVPFSLGTVTFAIGFLLWSAVRRRPTRRPQSSAWFVAPMAAAGVATARHVLTLAPRPPPAS